MQDISKFGIDRTVTSKYLDFEVVAAMRVSEWDETIQETWIVVGSRGDDYFAGHLTPSLSAYGLDDAWQIEYEVPVAPEHATMLATVFCHEEQDAMFGRSYRWKKAQKASA